MLLGFAKDYALEMALEELKKTFSDTQLNEYNDLEEKDDRSTVFLWVALGLSFASIFVSNYLFFGLDVSFWYILLTNIVVFPYTLYRAIKGKIKSLYHRVRFIKGLSRNFVKLSENAHEALNGALSKF